MACTAATTLMKFKRRKQREQELQAGLDAARDHAVVGSLAKEIRSEAVPPTDPSGAAHKHALENPESTGAVASPAEPSTQPCAATTAEQPLSYIEMVKQKKAAAARQAIEAHAGRRATESVARASNEEPLSYIELVKRKKWAAKMKQAADAAAPPSTEKVENQGKEEQEEQEDKEEQEDQEGNEQKAAGGPATTGTPFKDPGAAWARNRDAAVRRLASKGRGNARGPTSPGIARAMPMLTQTLTPGSRNPKVSQGQCQQRREKKRKGASGTPCRPPPGIQPTQRRQG